MIPLCILDATVRVFVDEDNVLKAIFFQTAEMKKIFESYPELLFIDATYKLNDLQMPLYVLMVVDGNGESEVVCLWLTQFEDKETITELIQGFKRLNPSWPSIQCVMSDKDMVERNVFYRGNATIKAIDLLISYSPHYAKRNYLREARHFTGGTKYVFRNCF